MSIHNKEFSFVSPITEDRYQDVIVHLRDNFYVDEPLNKCLNIFKKGEPHKDLDTMISSVLKDNLSSMAVHKASNTIAAVSLNCLFLPDAVEEKKRFCDTVSCDKFKRIATLLYKVNEPLHLFEKFDVDKIFDFNVLSTDSNYRKMGLGKQLIRISEDLAKKNGFKILKGDATGVYSTKILKSCGFEVIHELKYTDYLDENKQPIFEVEPPHFAITVLLKLLGSVKLK